MRKWPLIGVYDILSALQDCQSSALLALFSMATCTVGGERLGAHKPKRTCADVINVTDGCRLPAGKPYDAAHATCRHNRTGQSLAVEGSIGHSLMKSLVALMNDERN